jgi:hypothetical protein
VLATEPLPPALVDFVSRFDTGQFPHLQA